MMSKAGKPQNRVMVLLASLVMAVPVAGSPYAAQADAGAFLKSLEGGCE